MTDVATANDPSGGGAEPAPLATAKLAPPVLRPEVINRPRIARSLAAGPGSLALVVAPAGYGKTTAVRAWCAEHGAPLAWVTLDPADNDPVRLWAYVATAVDGVREGLGRTALQRLRVPGASIEAVVDELMNGVAAFGHEVVVVLDELETVTDPACLASIDHAAADTVIAAARSVDHPAIVVAPAHRRPRHRLERAAAASHVQLRHEPIGS